MCIPGRLGTGGGTNGAPGGGGRKGGRPGIGDFVTWSRPLSKNNGGDAGEYICGCDDMLMSFCSKPAKHITSFSPRFVG